MSQKIKITLILIVLLFLGLSINVFATNDISPIVPDTIANEALTIISDSNYSFDTDIHPWFYISSTDYYVLAVSCGWVDKFQSGIDGIFIMCNSSNNATDVCIQDFATGNKFPMAFVVFDKDLNLVYSGGSVSSFYLNDSTIRSIITNLSNDKGDIAVYSNFDMDIYGVSALHASSTDGYTPVFTSTLSMRVGLITTASLTPTSLTETLKTKLPILMTVSLLIFGALLLPYLIRYLISRLQ